MRTTDKRNALHQRERGSKHLAFCHLSTLLWSLVLLLASVQLSNAAEDTVITDFLGGAQLIGWSGDDTAVYVVADCFTMNYECFIRVPVDGSSPSEIGPLKDGVVEEKYGPQVSPDGQWILFRASTGLQKMSVNSGDVVLLDDPGIHEYATWSPTGDRVFFIDEAFAGPGIGFFRNAFTIRSDGSMEKVQLFDEWLEHDNLTFPDWHPDGSSVFMNLLDYENPDEYPTRSVIQLFTDGSGEFRTFEGLPAGYQFRRLSLDGSLFAAIALHEGCQSGSGDPIHILRATIGTLRDRIPCDPSGYTFPVWHPNSSAVTYSGRDGLYVHRLGSQPDTLLTENGWADVEFTSDGMRYAHNCIVNETRQICLADSDDLFQPVPAMSSAVVLGIAGGLFAAALMCPPNGRRGLG